MSPLRRARSRKPSPRAIRDAGLIEHIAKARSGYRRAYDVRKTWRELGRRGVDCGRERAARLMRQQGWHGVQRGRGPRTTRAEAAAERSRDLVERRFIAAFILDVYSRMICGWQIATHMRTDLVLDALEMAHALRQPDRP